MAKIKSGVYVPSIDCDINKTVDGVKLAWNKMKEYGAPIIPADPCLAGCGKSKYTFEPKGIE